MATAGETVEESKWARDMESTESRHCCVYGKKKSGGDALMYVFVEIRFADMVGTKKLIQDIHDDYKLPL